MRFPCCSCRFKSFFLYGVLFALLIVFWFSFSLKQEDEFYGESQLACLYDLGSERTSFFFFCLAMLSSVLRAIASSLFLRLTLVQIFDRSVLSEGEGQAARRSAEEAKGVGRSEGKLSACLSSCALVSSSHSRLFALSAPVFLLCSFYLAFCCRSCSQPMVACRRGLVWTRSNG
jgi:hypothetical protein